MKPANDFHWAIRPRDDQHAAMLNRGAGPTYRIPEPHPGSPTLQSMLSLAAILVAGMSVLVLIIGGVK